MLLSLAPFAVAFVVVYSDISPRVGVSRTIVALQLATLQLPEDGRLGHPRLENPSAPATPIVPEQTERPWWELWIGPIISGLIAIAIGVYNRRHTNSLFHKTAVRGAHEDEFKESIRDPLYEALSELRKLKTQVRLVRNATGDEARERIVELLETTAPPVIQQFFDALEDADHQLEAGGEWVEVATELEDRFVTEMSAAVDAVDTQHFASHVSAAASAITNAGGACVKKMLARRVEVLKQQT